MFGIGMPELILILAVALIVIGPKKLPDLAKSLGKAMGEFKKATNDIKDSMQLDSGIQEVKTSFEDLEKELKKPVETASAVDPSPGQEGPSEKAEVDVDTVTEAELPDTETAPPEILDADLTEAELDAYSPDPPSPEPEEPTRETPPEKTPRADKA